MHTSPLPLPLSVAFMDINIDKSLLSLKPLVPNKPSVRRVITSFQISTIPSDCHFSCSTLTRTNPRPTPFHRRVCLMYSGRCLLGHVLTRPQLFRDKLPFNASVGENKLRTRCWCDVFSVRSTAVFGVVLAFNRVKQHRVYMSENLFTHEQICGEETCAAGGSEPLPKLERRAEA